MKQPDLTGRLARWVFKLQGFKFSIRHRKGKENVVPDALSRIPIGELSGIEILQPTIDLESPHFNDEEYNQLKSKIRKNASQYPDVKIVDQFVYIRTDPYRGQLDQEDRCWKLWVPLQLRKSVISRSHNNSPTSAHCGVVKTLDLIRRNFFWPGLVHDVREYIRSCEICKSSKAPNFIMRPEMGQEVVISRPFQRLYVDILGPYPRSKQGYIGLLIVLDHLTKFHWLCPLRKFTSAAIQDYLIKNIFHMFGVPETLVSDNGSQFKANEFNAFLTSLDITHTYTALYSPQANASERVNRSIIAGIRSYLKKDHTLWDQHLSSISCALRNTYHQTIKCSPYQAVFGLDMVTHASSYNLLRNIGALNEPCLKLTRDDELQILRKKLKEYLSEAHAINSKQYNLRTRPISYQKGQIVFRRNFAQSCQEKKFNSKLAPLFIKATVKEKVGNNYYLLQDVEGKHTGTYHAKDIHP